MRPAAGQSLRDRWREHYQSRGAAAIMVLAIEFGILALFVVSLDQILIPQSPAVAPMLASLIDQPRGQHQDSEQLAIQPRLVKPTVHIPDTPPNLPIEIPVEIPPAPEPSMIAASLPPGTRDVAGEGSPRGQTEGADDGTGPGVLHQVAPVYSAASVQAHEHGVVALRVLVDAQGAPAQVQLSSSSGFPRLDQSAAEAVRHYRFSPPAQQTSPHQAWTTVKVEFDLLRMAAPTTVVQFDSAIANQIATAQRNRPGRKLEVMNVTGAVERLANRLFDALAQGRVTESSDTARGSPNPLLQLKTRGKLRSVRFLGFASEGFDCGTISVARPAGETQCEIFEVKQVSGTSYWLALIGNGGTRLQNVAITSATEPAQAGNLPH
jgi:periplasmic protein TonB